MIKTNPIFLIRHAFFSPKGFTRIFDVLPDISLDVPNANNMMDTVLLKCREKGFVGEDIMELAPNKY